MLHIINTWLQSRIVRKDEGATMVEYGLMVALIAVVVGVAAAVLGDDIAACSPRSRARLRLNNPAETDCGGLVLPRTAAVPAIKDSPMIVRFLKSEDGASMAEYALMAVLIAIAAFAAVGAFGDAVASLLDQPTFSALSN